MEIQAGPEDVDASHLQCNMDPKAKNITIESLLLYYYEALPI